MLLNTQKKIAILIPCHNEENTIGSVIDSFFKYIPESKVYVYDNASVDGTSEIAKAHGAIVSYEPNKGKGNVVRRMFADIVADIYIILDGDETYDVSMAPLMVNKLIDENLDMVVGTRKATIAKDAYRSGHIFGNWLLTSAVSLAFNSGFTDMLSGYRIMSHRFVKSFPINSNGFEIETEMTVHALQLKTPFSEVETSYDARPEGSQSKLNTWSDGFRILGMIVLLIKEYKPFQFFGIFSIVFAIISFMLSVPIILTWIDTGLVPRLPTAILSMGVMILAVISLSSGIILDSVSRARLEKKRLQYLTLNSVNSSIS
ncbi:glycosyltransferase family 2 protein [Candidatus Thioglobus autotrophicus]|uniref:glycosyltransferase family 2 protein n=1 Tax=Candidatus Thioglobus autotrophicus TaxID=1705394 RepID=UPI00299F141C|nr:glycosyltransferase family 2 protein [Candidatus Thioglobus autotrophicus]WPE17712.1 glycosyltransferase family 2 protein [Candidatus Thioglobus autotrophicus]